MMSDASQDNGIAATLSLLTIFRGNINRCFCEKKNTPPLPFCGKLCCQKFSRSDTEKEKQSESSFQRNT
jgi:hypothetical protein